MDRIAVYELQDALMQIFLAQGIRGAVYPDGIYGPETAEAVRAFQQTEGLPVTGEADRETWERIQTRLYAIIKALEVLPIPVFPNGDFALVPGAGGLLVGLVQGIFQRLHETYKNIPAPALTWIYDRETAEAAAVIREKAGLSPGEELDAQAWNVLARLYASVQL